MALRIKHGTEPDESAGIQGAPELTPGYFNSLKLLLTKQLATSACTSIQ
jgi:hypothetical protein